MLVVSRSRGQKIMIGDDIEILIVDAHGQVKVGVHAPKEIPVHREEVYARIKREQSVGPFKTPAEDAADEWASYTGAKR